MTKRSVVFTISLTVLIFIVGCSPTKPEPAKTAEAKPPKVEAPEVKPPKVELPKVEPPNEPPKIEPPKIEPPKIEPPKIEPPKIEPPKVEPPNEPPKIEPPKAKPRPTVSLHDKCAGILNNNLINDKGMVDYKTLRRKRAELKNLLGEFAKLNPNEYNSWPKEDKIAFWLNAYNIEMLKIIVDNYPIKSSRIHRIFWPPNSIRHISGIWDKYKFIVMDEEFTLAEIEQRFFRKKFDEPQVFFAISHASLSSPPLRNEPYYGGKLYKQLDDQVKRTLSSSRGLKIDRKKQRVYLPAILQSTWYGSEFISKYGTDKKFKDQQPPVRAVLNFITNYISEQDVSFLEVGNYSVKYTKYDWTLNE